MYFFLPWYANSGVNGNQEAAEKGYLILVLFMKLAMKYCMRGVWQQQLRAI